MEPRPLFVAFGIPVSFDPFFFFGAFLFYSWSGGGRRGLYAVIALVAFVVIHEFGHALTAKSFGARAAITITFLGGFAAYVPQRRLTTRHNVAISAAGPLTQLAVAVPAMWWALHRFTEATTAAQAETAWDLYQAITWAGVTIAVINLLPAWPLDGGHITEALLRRAFGDRVVRPFTVFSLGLAGAMIALYVARRIEPDTALFRFLDGPPYSSADLSLGPALLRELRSLPGFIFGGTIFIPGIIGFGAYERLGRLNRATLRVTTENVRSGREMARDEAVRRTRQAEREAWISGTIGEFPRGWEPSPWVRAHVALIAGRHDEAVQHLARLAQDHDRRWLVDRPDREALATLLAYVPPEVSGSLAVLEARVHHGTPEELVATASTRFAAERSAEPLYLGAAGLAVRGLDDEAMAWLVRAVAISPDPHRMATEREFHTLHRRSDFQRLLGEAERAAGVTR